MFSAKQKKVLFYSVFIALFLVVFSAGIFVGKRHVVCNACKPETVDFSLFWDAYNKLRESFVNPDKIVDQQVVYGAIEGMTKSLDDPYTAFFDPDQAKVFEQDLSGSFDGIGIEVAIKKDQLTVVAPLKGSPSEKAGIKAGDKIVQINGKSASDITTEEAVNIIRGKRGTDVTLTIFIDGWKDTEDFTITRDTIKILSIDWKLEDENVAYIHIYQFDQMLSSDFNKIALEILKSPARKIVLDLRNNPGGYLEVCQDIAGWFLQNGQVVTIEDFGKDEEPQLYKANGSSTFAEYPTVALINEGSASASEILAGALRDQRNIQLIGEKSFGKGSVQEIVNLQDGLSFLKVTIAKWLTPKGHSISEVGLTPDIKIEISESDFAANKDPQKEKALEIIRTLQ